MSNIMSNFKVKNNVSRNGFDLTFRNTFSAKVGELLPIMCEECIPGDKFKINLQGFSRTEPLTSPAFVRIKEYYDFIFVPYRLLWRYADEFLTQMPNRTSSSTFYSETTSFTRNPYFSSLSAYQYMELYANSNYDLDDVGFDREDSSKKLLEYLDYDPWNWYTNTQANAALNVFPLLAYQKAYADIYRFDQWENPEPHTFNVDFLNQSNMELGFPTSASNIPVHDIFSMRYANYAKDMFMGLLPNSQYGDVSVVNTTTGMSRLSVWDNESGTATMRYVQPNSDESFNSEDALNKYFNFSVLALRQAEFLQKYKEVTQTAKQDYKAQIKAHWGVDVSSARSNLCEYVGGVDGVVQIDQVVNQNLSSDQSVSDPVLKGIASGFGRGEIDYDVKEHGLMLCIYHAAPILQYSGGIAPINFKTTATDYAIPEMDKTGMQSIPAQWFTGLVRGSQSGAYEGIVGYAPRYIEYKTKLDKVHGNMIKGGSFENWVAPLHAASLYAQLFSPNIDMYQILKVKPSFLDDVFATSADANVSTDQLKCNVDFDMKVVRNLDYDGMPY